MSGLSAINSKLRYLKSVSVERARGKQVSVVYINEDGVIEWPELPNQNGGVLVVPHTITIEQWVGKYGQQGG